MTGELEQPARMPVRSLPGVTGSWPLIPDPADRLSKADRPPPCAVIAVALINRIPYHCPFPAPHGVCHQPTRRRERQMKRFKSPGQAQRFLSAHDRINPMR